MIQIFEKKRKLSLSNYKGKYLQCPNCGKPRLKPYSYEDGRIESEILGRCQREVNCGYHLKPSEYFKDKGGFENAVKFLPPVQKKMYILDKLVVEKFTKTYKQSTLFQFLQQTGIDFSPVFEKYKMGATKVGATVFFQFDGSVFRTGKLIKYLENGHRDKSVRPPVLWLHNKTGDFDENKQEVRQCLFGRHLIDESNVTCIVESEKTALLCAGLFPRAVWMATGGRTQLSGLALAELSRKKVLLFPDSDSVLYWQEKTRTFGNCEVIDTTEFNRDKKQGADIADYILEGAREDREMVFKLINQCIDMHLNR